MAQRSRQQPAQDGADHAAGPQPPECIVLPARQSGVAPSSEPVRIFLGTQPEQLRAERVFVFSVEKTRDPAREYRIYRMSCLPGFDRRGWRTGFTNYRFAIPEFAGFEGRAIYNDVDQIYTVDPGVLFDLELDGYGYRAVSASDTSVMIMDCARMGDVWNWDRATRLDKKQLVAEAAGRWGSLDGDWNARDLEFLPGQSKLLHYTALHLQPWQPTPEQFSYHHHPLSEVWLALERAADAERFDVFTAERPTADFAPAMCAQRPIPEKLAATVIDRWSRVLEQSAEPRLAVLGGVETDRHDGVTLQTFDPRRAAAADVVLLPADRFDRLPVGDVPWVLAAGFAAATGAVDVCVTCGHPQAETGSELGRARTPRWWREQIGRAASRRPELRCRLELRAEGGKAEVVEWGPEPQPAADGKPSIWILCGERMGDNAQLRRLAASLGGEVQEKHLRFNLLSALPGGFLGATRAGVSGRHSPDLSPPWPDLVLASGRRSAPVARWIRKRSGGRTRLVHIGRPWAPLEHFDLVITTPQYGLPVRDNVLHNVLPLNIPAAEELEAAAQRWRDELSGLPGPRIAALIGGEARPFFFDVEVARRFARELDRRAAERQGSLLIAFGSRCPPASVRALLDGLSVPTHAYWPGQGRDNPYLAYLALADEFVVTGDSASMLADACSTGRPVALYRLPERPDLRLRVVRGLRRLLAGKTSRASHRGTPKQQGVGGRLYDYLTAQGLINSTREMTLLHDELILRGLVVPLGEQPTPVEPIPLANDLDLALRRIRAMMHTSAR